MAAPAEITVQNLEGQWQLDYTLSDPPDPVLTLQGISWFVRKAISMATVTLDISETVNAEDGKVHIDIGQTLTGGLQGTAEHRVLDWETRPHSDHIFGTLEGQSRFFGGGPDAGGKTRPAVEVQTTVQDEQIAKFLKAEILADGTPSEGFLVDPIDAGKGGAAAAGADSSNGLWVQSWVKNLDPGYEWTGEQIWGFEEVNGERRYTRRVVVAAKDGKYILARLVYSYIGPRPEPVEDEPQE